MNSAFDAERSTSLTNINRCTAHRCALTFVFNAAPDFPCFGEFFSLIV